MSFLKQAVKKLNDEYTSMAVAGTSSSEFSDTIDTGSYVLNAVLSGSIYGGVPNNKITAFAGESSTGKTFFVLGIIKSFLDKNEDAEVVYFDTESAVTNDVLLNRGVDIERVVKSEPESIESFRYISLQFLEQYMEVPADERTPLLFVLDSLGQLSSSKELEDTSTGKEVRDMTKAQQLKATFRVLSLKLAKAGVPLLVTNHVYDSVGAYIPMKEMSGGSGLKYSAATIAFLSKRKEKDGTEVVGNIIKVRMHKSRVSRENKEVSVLLTYDKGLDQYYGLAELAVKYGIFKKVSTRIELPDGRKLYEKNINENPVEHFTPEILDKIEEYAIKEFSYGGFCDVSAEVDDVESSLGIPKIGELSELDGVE